MDWIAAASLRSLARIIGVLYLVDMVGAFEGDRRWS